MEPEAAEQMKVLSTLWSREGSSKKPGAELQHSLDHCGLVLATALGPVRAPFNFFQSKYTQQNLVLFIHIPSSST